MKVLINTPDTNTLGGVANHYRGLKPYWSESVYYNFIAGRKGIPGVILLPFDLVFFFFKLLFGRYDNVLLNPSLGKTALKRDALFLKIASWFNVKKIVFFHGWEDELAVEITNSPGWFVKHYGKADAFLVLSGAFKQQMESWGISKPIYLTTTKVDDSLVEGFDVGEKQLSDTLLFLARIEENKGVFVALDTLKILHKNYPELKLIIAGDGGALNIAKQYAKDNNIGNVDFLGRVSGKILIETFQKSDIYVLPTWHGEGMPTSILEAMAFGLPIITRPVGGLRDFFLEGEMGLISESLDPIWYAGSIDKLFSNPELMKNIAKYNHAYAQEHFLASKVARQIEAILAGV